MESGEELGTLKKEKTSKFLSIFRPPDKKAQLKNYFLISQQKHNNEPRHVISNNVVF